MKIVNGQVVIPCSDQLMAECRRYEVAADVIPASHPTDPQSAGEVYGSILEEDLDNLFLSPEKNLLVERERTT